MALLRSSFICLLILAMASFAQASTLENVKKDGFLKCGTHIENPGFSALDSDGNRVGFDVDFCSLRLQQPLMFLKSNLPLLHLKSVCLLCSPEKLIFFPVLPPIP